MRWALTDYEAGSGQLQYVPGSHRLARHPAPGAGHDQLVTVVAEAGSIIFWHGNTWRRVVANEPGRAHQLIVAMTRSYLRPQELYKENVTPEIPGEEPASLCHSLGSACCTAGSRLSPSNIDSSVGQTPDPTPTRDPPPIRAKEAVAQQPPKD